MRVLVTGATGRVGHAVASALVERGDAVRALVRAPARVGVPRVVHTSTIDVFHAEPGARFDERDVAGYPKGTAYERVSRLIRKPPLLPSGQLCFFLWNATPDSTKARRELGWTPTPLDDGLRATLAA